MVPLVVLGGGLLAAGLFALTRKHPSSSVGKLARVSLPRGMVRLRIRVPLTTQRQLSAMAKPPTTPEAHLTACLKRVVSDVAPARVLLAAHDPTDPETWSFILESSGGKLKAPLAVVSMEQVEVPRVDTRIFRHDELDERMTNDEATTVLYALRHDDNPKHLGGLAFTLEDDYPISAALLRAKARLQTLRMAARRKSGPLAPMPELEKAFKALDIPLEPYEHARMSLVGYKMPFKIVPAPEGAVEKFKSIENDDTIGDLNRVLGAFSRDPKKLGQKSDEVGTAMRVSPITVDAARSMVQVMPGMVVLIDPSKRKLIRPLTRKPLTMAALQLAHSTRRPILSGVARPEAIKARYNQIGQDKAKGDKDAAEAQALLDRADKALSLRQWIEWYKRIQSVPKSDGPPPGSLTGAFLRPRSP